MKKLTFVLSAVILLGAAGVTKLSANRALPTTESVRKPAANFTASLSRGSNVSGSWVIEFSGSAGTYRFAFNSGNVTVPSGTYNVGIYPAGGGSTIYSISGSVCTLNYGTSGSSAYFTNVPCTCGSGSFSVN
jgi:hypothetical protein